MSAAPTNDCTRECPNVVWFDLGIVGALLGGFLGRAIGFYGPGDAASLVMSLIGAMMLLRFYRLLVAHRA